jgi:hypothetical protein
MLGMRFSRRRGRPKLLTFVDWFTVLATVAVAEGGAFAFVR